ncbi:hypothetical protein Deba_0220 [Desulfarculus baarsii DSM 2075]|uniref:Zinc-finger domain-containing protein n=1 Tax=Desulfarculus baarsii (strain ATCC 33931 / DSM 2075 / LMG 7858 / VKM B-1802 / 2st14) TaxID=644282 RepID=E1QG85_DESB2|nr:hypothetical protein [Desulfarculus baarsii]ADK83597.1 hypothetical protein Deba_0220 [Desulfarculus baarsii DSM 2075]
MRATEHIGEAEIIRAAVDQDGSSQIVRAHLAACGYCRAQVEALAADLAALAPAAARVVKAPPRPPRLALARRKRQAERWLWPLRGLAAAAVAAAVALNLATPLQPPSQPAPVAPLAVAAPPAQAPAPLAQAAPPMEPTQAPARPAPAAPATLAQAAPPADDLDEPLDLVGLAGQWTRSAPTEMYWQPEEPFDRFKRFVISGGMRQADQEFFEAAVSDVDEPRS